MTKEQIQVIKCAYADLVGALQAKEQGNMQAHDWKAHLETIRELEASFQFIEPVELDDE